MTDRMHIYSKNIDIFLTFCETKSLKKTAELFDLSISATSRQLAKLEAELGLSLFDRSCRPMQFTAVGRKLEQELIPGLVHAHNVVTTLRSQSFIRQDLRIGFVDSLTYAAAPLFIGKIQSRVGHITCLTGSSDRLIERLKARELDVIVSSYQAPDIANLKRLFLLKEPSVIVLPKSVDTGCGAWTWGRLMTLGLPYIQPYAQSGSGILSNSFLKTAGLQFTGVLTVDNMGLKLQLVAQNKGWFITRTVGFLNHLDILDKLTVTPVPSPGMYREVYVLANENISREMFVEIFNTLVAVMQESILPKLFKIFPKIKDETILAKEQHA